MAGDASAGVPTPRSEIRFEELVRDVPDFPKPGILFKDITPLLADADALASAIDSMVEPWRDSNVEFVVGIEARGFIFGSLVGAALDAGFVPARKPGKLPGATLSQSYGLEYGSDAIEMHSDALRRGSRVLVVDDVLATGGTAAAAAKLVESCGADLVGFGFLIELEFLDGRSKLGTAPVSAAISYGPHGEGG